MTLIKLTWHLLNFDTNNPKPGLSAWSWSQGGQIHWTVYKDDWMKYLWNFWRIIRINSYLCKNLLVQKERFFLFIDNFWQKILFSVLSSSQLLRNFNWGLHIIASHLHADVVSYFTRLSNLVSDDLDILQLQLRQVRPGDQDHCDHCDHGESRDQLSWPEHQLCLPRGNQ